LTDAPRRLAIVLSGGGARGAYEAGVLSYLFDDLPRVRGRAIQVDIVCGTSVGAINSVFLAAHLTDARYGVRRLVELWQTLRLEKVLGFGVRQATALPRLLIGGMADGLFDVTPMAKLVGQEIPWRAITRTFRAGALRALSITCTEVSTGRTVLFMQTGPGTGLPAHAPPRTLIRGERIGPHHALASASIPLLFPPVPIGNQLYMDGGLRQNTPIAPALRLGATHAIIVGTSRPTRGVVTGEALEPPNAAFVLGKIMNALLLDHLDADLATVGLLNDLIDSGRAAYGSHFEGTLNRAAASRGGHLMQRVSTLVVRPSETIGGLTAEFLRRGGIKSGSALTRQVLRWVDSGKNEADFGSYLLFDGEFAKMLIELGRSDARAQRDHILEFLEELDSAPPAPSGPASPYEMPPPAVG
jgi:NTE family protein